MTCISLKTPLTVVHDFYPETEKCDFAIDAGVRARGD